MHFRQDVQKNTTFNQLDVTTVTETQSSHSKGRVCCQQPLARTIYSLSLELHLANVSVLAPGATLMTHCISNSAVSHLNYVLQSH